MRVRSFACALLLVAIPQSAIAQVAEPSPPAKEWNFDIAGTIGVTAGIGAATSGLDVSGAAAVVRTRRPAPSQHRCLGLTAMVTIAPREWSVLTGPRWDAGDLEGVAFVRILAGLRHISGPPRQSDGEPEWSASTLGVGAGAGVSVLGVLLDVNWVMSPWDERAPHRLSISLGYIRSF